MHGACHQTPCSHGTARTAQAEELQHASTRAELGRAEEEVAAVTRRHDAAAAWGGDLQRALEEVQQTAAREAEAAAATLRTAMDASAGQDAGARQAAQAAQAAAERSVQGLQSQVNGLDQRLQQALAQVCSSKP